MNKQKVKIDQRKEIVLLTELLPFETPLFFSNRGFFNFRTRKKNNPPFIKTLFSKRKFYKPYNFEVKRSETKYRNLSIIHPILQIEFCEFYNDYADLMLEFCSKSKFSLRKPVKCSKSIFIDKAEKSGLKIPTHYFNYLPYNLLSKFHTSFEYNRLEKGYKKMAKIDISKFFPSIYTHSISWAIKSKSFSKENINKFSFEGEFDRLMQAANYKETNGILIGPEISRIFAEIIAQKIDVTIEARLKDNDIIFGREYKIKRYVDDYYIFSNSSELLEGILQVIEEELEKYKLHINESKTEFKNAPYISGISIAKIEISNSLNEFISRFRRNNQEEQGISESRNLVIGNIKKIIKPRIISMRLIDKIKAALNRGQIDISKVSKYTFTIIENKLKDILPMDKSFSLDDVEETNLRTFIFIVLDIAFYIASLDTVTKNTNSLIKISLIIREFYLKNGVNYLKLIEKRINDELLLLLKSLNHKNKDSSVEAINILVALKNLNKDFELSEKEIDKYFKLNLSKNELIPVSYFKFVGVMYYIKGNNKYDNIRTKLTTSILNRFEKEDLPLDNTELFCLFFDSLKFNFFDNSFKFQLLDGVAKKEFNRNLDVSEKGEIINFIQRYNWFVEWNTGIDKLLKRKQFSLDY